MKVVLIFALLILSQSAFGQDDSWRDSLDVARQAYNSKNYAKALKYYESAQKKAPDNIDLSDEMAQSAYKAREFEKAEKIYQQSSGSKKNKAQRGDSFHNLGNSRMQQEDYAGAVDAYKESLRNNPKDDRTRYNLSEAIRRLKDQERKNPPQDPNEPQDPNDPQDPQDPEDGNDGEEKEGGDQNSDQDGQGDEKKDHKNGSSGSNGSKKDGEGQLPNQMIERTLDNLARKEAETKQRMRGGGKAGKPSKSGKDW